MKRQIDPGPWLAPLRGRLGPLGVLTDHDDLAPFVTDWRGKLRGRTAAVLRPASVDEVVTVVRWAREHAVPLVPQGGNTGLCGGATPDETGAEVVLSLSRLDRIRSVDAAANTLLADAGCVLANVQSAATEVGRLFPMSLAAEGSSQIGGLVSTNAGGMAVLRYGNMRDLVLGLEVVLPSGEVLSDLAGLRKNNTGYDWKQLFIGSEGTLGVVTAATLKLFPRPRAVATAFAAVPSLAAATALLRFVQDAFGDAVTAFEVASARALALVARHFPELRMPLGGEAAFFVVCALSMSAEGAEGEKPAALAALEDTLGEAAARDLVTDAAVAQNETQARAFWRWRESITESEKREGPSVKHDISVPISRLPDFVTAAEAAALQVAPEATVLVFGHLGDGSLHVNVIVPAPAGTARGVDHAIEAALFERIHDLAAAHDGSFSAEHGVGRIKVAELARYKDPAALALMWTLKNALDPQGIMNPGRVLPPR